MIFFSYGNICETHWNKQKHEMMSVSVISLLFSSSQGKEDMAYLTAQARSAHYDKASAMRNTKLHQPPQDKRRDPAATHWAPRVHQD